MDLGAGCSKLKVLIFGENPSGILLDTSAWENTHASFTSPHTEERTENFQPFLIHLKMGIEKGDRFSTAA